MCLHPFSGLDQSLEDDFHDLGVLCEEIIIDEIKPAIGADPACIGDDAGRPLGLGDRQEWIPYGPGVDAFAGEGCLAIGGFKESRFDVAEAQTFALESGCEQVMTARSP